MKAIMKFYVRRKRTSFHSNHEFQINVTCTKALIRNVTKTVLETSNDTCLFLIPRAGQVHHSRIEQTGSICYVKMTKVKNSSWINIDVHIHRKTGLTNFTFSFLQIKNLISDAPTKVICGRVKVLLRWGAGDGQSPAEATVVHHHIQEDM